MPQTIDNGSTGKIALYCVLLSDHITPATGKTIAVTISKNGAGFGNPSGGATNATEIGSGWYYFTPSGTDTGTNGPLIVLGTNAATDDSTRDFIIAAAATSAPTAAQNATAVWQDATSGDFTVTSSIGKSLYTSGDAPGSSGGLLKIGTSPLPASGTLAAATWDEINTGATHNIANSTGKQLRSVTVNASEVIYSSVLPSQAGMTTSQVKLDSGASAVDNAYQWDVFSAVAGTGQGSRICLSYVGATRVATLASAWTVAPVATDTVEITPTASVQVATYVAGQDPATLVWAAATRTLTTAIPTAAAIATAVWTDTTAGDFTTSTSPGKIIFGQLGGAFTTTSSSVFSSAALANGPTGGGGTVDANLISVNGTTFAGVNVPAILADGVAHGGTPGSSTATLALEAITLANASGPGIDCKGTVGALIHATAGDGMRISGAAAGAGLNIQGGATGDGLDITAGLSASSSASGMYIQGGGDGTSDGNAIFLYTSKGNTIEIEPTTGHGINILANGTGKKAILLAGDAATDSFAIAAGTGSPIPVFDAQARVTGSATLLDATPTTDPAGVASTFPQMLVQVWRYCFKRKTKAVSGLTIKTYADDNITVNTTQSYTDDGAGNQSQGSAT